MTVLDALKSEVSYPVPADFFERTLIVRGLNGSDEFTQAVALGRSYRLAYADCLKRHITAVNIAESGLSISLQDRDKIAAIANSIYREYGEQEIELESAIPTVEFW